MINCYFDGAYTSVTSHPAYLHDYGQILRVFDLDLPAVVEAHFALEESGESILRMGTCDGGITHIPIPDSCLEDVGSFFCYIFDRDSTSGKTVYKIKIPVLKRADMPTETTDPSEQDVAYFEQVLASVDEAVTEVKNAKDTMLNGLTIGTVETLDSGEDAEASITNEDDVLKLNLGIPKGDMGDGGGVGESTTGQTVTYSGTDYECGTGAERFNDYSSNLAIGAYSHAEGYQAVSVGSYGHAEGVTTKALGNYSHAEGGGCEAHGQAAHAEGSGTKAIGNTSHAEGGGTVASGHQSHAEGSGTTASGVNSHAEGGGTTATEFEAHAEGGGTTASGQDSHAEGYQTKATGNYTHAEGRETEAIGIKSHAEGYKTKTTGEQSHAEGSQTKATANSSHAEGASTEASGMNAHAEGVSTIASGVASHAEGAITNANGSYSHSEGTGTSASSNNQHVQGKYNVDDQYDKYADIVGIGTSSNARANGETTDWTGVKWLKTDVRCGGSNMDDPSAISLVALANMITALEARVTALEGGNG